jgi:hypothetical protein
MKTTISFFLLTVIFCDFTLAQTDEIRELNYLFDTKTYYDIELDYKKNITLPDSIKQKFISVLRGEVPKKIADSILFFTQQDKERYWEYSQKKCNGDSICSKEMYNNLYQKWYDDKYKKLYDYYKVNKTVVLAAGSWYINDVVPILENAIGDSKYDQPAVLMALAKLGNDSIKQILIEKYSLPYILQTTELDTVNDNFLYWDNWTTQILDEGIRVAMYLKNKEILLNLTDLIYIRGRDDMNIAESFTVSWFVNDFDDYNYFHTFPNFDVLRQICYGYACAIWDLDDRKLNKKEKKKLKMLLSTEYRTKIRNKMRKWVIENVNFENMQQ